MPCLVLSDAAGQALKELIVHGRLDGASIRMTYTHLHRPMMAVVHMIADEGSTFCRTSFISVLACPRHQKKATDRTDTTFARTTG
jgi:hypothetical protein